MAPKANNHPVIPRDPLQRGLLAAIIEGSAFSVWAGALGGNFLTGMALYFGAGGFALGVLGGLNSLSSMLQLVSAPFVVGLKNRRNFLAILSGMQRFGGVIAGVLALLLMPSPLALVVFIAMQVISWACMAPSTVVWNGYMTDLVPMEIRGRYFAKRNAWATAISMLAVLAYGVIMDRFPGAAGFRYLYVAAFLAAAVDLAAWFMHPNLPQGDTSSGLSFWDSIRAPLTRRGPHRPAALFFAAWAFAQGMAGPFYSVQLLQKLGISFGKVSILATIGALTSIVTSTLWGRLQDRIGETRTVGLHAGLLALVPLLFMAGGVGGWPVLILAHMLNSSAGNGFGLANQTLQMRLAPKEDRGAYFAFFAVAGGLTGFITPVLVGPLTSNHLNLLLLGAAVASGLLSLLWHVKIRPLVEPAV